MVYFIIKRGNSKKELITLSLHVKKPARQCPRINVLRQKASKTVSFGPNTKFCTGKMYGSIGHWNVPESNLQNPV
jgi:hypothetical protein